MLCSIFFQGEHGHGHGHNHMHGHHGHGHSHHGQLQLQEHGHRGCDGHAHGHSFDECTDECGHTCCEEPPALDLTVMEQGDACASACCPTLLPDDFYGPVRLNAHCDFQGHCIQLKNTFVHIQCSHSDDEDAGDDCFVCSLTRYRSRSCDLENAGGSLAGLPIGTAGTEGRSRSSNETAAAAVSRRAIRAGRIQNGRAGNSDDDRASRDEHNEDKASKDDHDEDQTSKDDHDVEDDALGIVLQ